MAVTTKEADVALLKGMFPQFNEDRLRQTLAYHRGNVDQAATELLSGGTTPVHAPPPATAEWACATCTFANAASSQQCAMCDSPNPTRETASPLRVSAPSTPPPSVPLSHTTSTNLFISFYKILIKISINICGIVQEATTGEERVVPPWWNTFWREHQSTVTCDERMAKEILFTVRAPFVFCTKRGQWLISRAGCRIVANREDGSRTARSSHWTSSHESSGCWEERRCVRPARLNKQIRQMTNCLTHLVIVVNESLAAGAHDCNGLLHRRLRFARSSLWPKGRQTLKPLCPGG
jgi:hypothetical protein